MISTQSPDAKIIKEGQFVIRARNLRAATGFIPLKNTDKNNVNRFITLTDLGIAKLIINIRPGAVKIVVE
ncbi:hypothetical protein HanRHA438_Chr04g0174961 [Helianthus annuus]|uniref:Uncharacterized protein n=1 Tax=Helianthus annuus TaxID=4232 RepID=A0A251UYM9_HELAN|nr:hypothetical protein HanXRQr2_Chr04g0165281 [Helianthus annuus]KAJ0580985.1 hypothetical protein HanHA300_Chr04g0135731 [Helianthus annuus]KAJ0596924.1 hypothetical protein HanHA89_Chr04g0148611 [Helianthus annuus]KAJ0757606.1 hypothetical protein HanLR1_Chr04g0140721 [Helianthus annuus]KAJ0761290.1 hypothetical protein HanOQP8_Chr04g0148131 [Helianthus annuus]